MTNRKNRRITIILPEEMLEIKEAVLLLLEEIEKEIKK